jgi:hypothetical protein
MQCEHGGCLWSPELPSCDSELQHRSPAPASSAPEPACATRAAGATVRPSQQAWSGIGAKAHANEGIGSSANSTIAVQYRQQLFMCVSGRARGPIGIKVRRHRRGPV